MTFKRGDEFLSASECGVVTQAGELATLVTAALAVGVAVVSAPIPILGSVGVSAALLAAGHHLDHKKLDTQDNTPVVIAHA